MNYSNQILEQVRSIIAETDPQGAASLTAEQLTALCNIVKSVN